MKPGEVIGPGEKAPEDIQNPPQAETSSPAPEPETGPEPTAEAPETNWQFSTEETGASEPSRPTPHETITWTASEYIAHEKGANWFVLLGLAVFGVAAVVYLVTQEVVSTVVVLVMGIAFGAFAARQPQELTYMLSNDALSIGPKAYPYSQFKSFTVLEEGPIHSIMLMPLQRFMPPLSVYYDPKDEEKIAEALSSYLPYEDRKQDAVDRFMRKVRF